MASQTGQFKFTIPHHLVYCFQTQQVLSADTVDPVALDNVLEELVNATTVMSNDSSSQFPRSLQTTNDVLNMTVDFLMENLITNSNDPVPLSVVSSYLYYAIWDIGL